MARRVFYMDVKHKKRPLKKVAKACRKEDAFREKCGFCYQAATAGANSAIRAFAAIKAFSALSGPIFKPSA